MPIRQIKLQSDSHPPFSKSEHNIIDIDIPADVGSSNLARSYVVFKTTIDTTGDGVHNVGFGDSANDSMPYSANALIKLCRLESSTKGVLEDIKGHNVIFTNLHQRVRDFDELNSEELFGVYREQDIQGNIYTPFRNLYKQGTTTSAELEPEIHIPLRTMFGLGNVDNFNHGGVGKLRMHFELEDIIPVVRQFRRYTDHTTSALAFNDKVAGGAPITELVATDIFDNDEDFPLWVGQSLNVQYSVAASPQTKNVLVGAITRDSVTGVVTITLSTDIGSADVTAVTVIENAATTIEYNISDAQLVLFQQVGKQAPRQQVVYRTFEVERLNKSAHETYEQQFDIPGNCITALGLTPTTTLISVVDNCSSYRYRLNNIDTTDRNIEPNQSPLYIDRMTLSLLNSGLPVHNLKTGFTNQALFLNPIPLQDAPQVLHLSMKFSSAPACPVIYFYKQVERVLKS